MVLDEIVEIVEVGEEETIDINVSHNNLFYANGILTHNCGQGASDFDLTEVADSAGISMTADWIIGMISTDELEQLGHMRFKQLKNRHGSLMPKTFIVGVNRSKMQLYDVDIGTSDLTPVNKLDNIASKSDVTNKLNFD